jgi:hypothetical protein
MHKQTMQGKFMLQLDEVVNIAAGIKDRWAAWAQHLQVVTHLCHVWWRFCCVTTNPRQQLVASICLLVTVC